MVHCETSTGMVNDLDGVAAFAKRENIKLSVDVISSIGLIEIDLSGIYLASGVSGKGLLSYTGISMVFYNGEVLKNSIKIPHYLNLYNYTKSDLDYKITFLEFGSTGCSACKRMESVMESIKTNYPN